MFKTGRELDTGQTLSWLSGMLDSSTGEVSRPCYPLSHESPRAWLTQARLSPSELLVVFFPFVFVFFFFLDQRFSNPALGSSQRSQQTAELRRSLWPVDPHLLLQPDQFCFDLLNELSFQIRFCLARNSMKNAFQNH